MSERNKNNKYKGRGGRKYQKNNNAGSKKDSKKSINDYYYYLGSSKQASDYESTTEFVINYIKKTYEYGADIAMALETMEEVDLDQWKPNLTVSVATDDAIRLAETRQYEIEFRTDYSNYSGRVKAYENNKTKAYGLLWE